MRISNPIKRSCALITLAAVTATSSFAANYNTSLGTTDWFTASNYDPVGVPDAATAVRILTTTDVAAEINTPGALASAIDLGLYNWPGKLAVGASGTLDVTDNLVAQSAINGDQTSSLTNNGVITLGLSLYSRGINTFDNSGTLTAAGFVLGDGADVETTFTNTGLIDVGAGWIHLSNGSTVATEFNMNGGTLTAGKLNVQGGGKANLNLHGGTITAGSMSDASADFHIDISDDGELILNGNQTAGLNTMITAGYITCSDDGYGAAASFDGTSTALKAVYVPTTFGWVSGLNANFGNTSDWETPNNWFNQGLSGASTYLPGVADTVTIGGVYNNSIPNDLILSSTQTIGSLTIGYGLGGDEDGALTINSSGALTVANSVALGSSDRHGTLTVNDRGSVQALAFSFGANAASAGHLVVNAGGALTTTATNGIVMSAGGNGSTINNSGVMNTGNVVSQGVDTLTNSGIITTTGSFIFGGTLGAQTTFTNTGDIDIDAWIHLSTGSTVATEFNMNGGTVTVDRLNVQGGGKANLNLHGGTITAGSMADASADFHIDVNGDGELILNGDVVSELDSWIVAGYIFTSAGSGGAVALYDANSHTTRLYADTSAPTPDPAGFDGAPVALDTTSVGMLATQGSDASGVVEYLFTETSGNSGGTSSSWQSSPYYEDAGLTAGLQYSYTVTMRDAVGNVGAASAVWSVTVPATTPAAATAAQSGGWSDPATWGGSLPAAESDVTIPMGVTVTLIGDRECGSVTVMGKLTADPAADCSLHCDWVMVMGAGSAFEVGTNAVRYPHQFTLTLKGLASEGMTVGSHDVGSKFLVSMNGGTIDIHGPERVSWTKLSATSVAGSTTLTLDDAVDWVAGEMLVVTSTDTNWNHAEEMTVAAVSGDGLIVTLTDPLAYAHTGVTETHTRPSDGKSWSIELKAEVGLLSRAVTIQGDIYSEHSGYGGHSMAMLHDGMMPGALYVEGAELYRMGQKSIMARYPIHWHLMTDQAQGQYVRNSSIHHSFNRAVTIHGTDYITVEDNFCYDHIGHGIFLENGAERFNTIKGNVVLLTKRPAPGEELTPSDNERDEFQNRTPASFWITNPNNIIEDNIAAGTQGTGFWFIFPKTPLEPAASLPYYAGAQPSKEPLGSFDRNTAHSCMSGLDINDELRSDHSIQPNGAWDNNGPFKFNDCAWFSNDTALYAGTGLNSENRQDNVIYANNTLADNVDGIILATYHTVEESMLIADSGHGNLLGETATMYWLYDGAGQMVNNHMIGWDGETANLLHNPGASTKHPNHRFSGFTWDHAGTPRNVQPVFDYPLPLQWSQVIHDVDGSVGGLPGSSIISDHPFMVVGNETQPANWEHNLVSPNRYAHLRVKYSVGVTPLMNVTVLRSKDGTKTEGLAYLGEFDTHHHQLALLVNEDFLYTYHYETMPAANQIYFNFDDTAVGDSVLICIKEFGKLTGLSAPGTAHASLAALQASSSTGHYVEPNGDLYLRPVSTQPLWNEFSVTWTGTLTLPLVDSDLDGVSDVDEWNNGTDPFGFPEATPQSVALNEDGTLAITLSGSDPENDPLSFAVTTQPANGVLSGSAPNLTYTPNADFNGSDSFTFSVNDGGSSNSATVSITVNAQNDDPLFSADPITGANATKDVAYVGSLSATDVDGDSLTYSAVSGPAWLSVATDGSLSGTPLVGDMGANAWTVEVSDGNGGLNQATLNILVGGTQHFSGSAGAGDPSWFTASNWSLGLVPTAADTIQAIAPGTLPYGVVVDASGAVSNSINVGIWSHRGELNIAAGADLTISGGLNVSAGDGGNGSAVTNAGELNVGTDLNLSTGTATAGDGSLTNTGDLNVTGSLEIAQAVGGTGTLTLDAGTVDADSGTIASGGTGTLTINAGSLNIANRLTVTTAGNGTLTMNGGTLTADWLDMSNDTTAHLQLNGGTIDVRVLSLSSLTLATNTIDLSGGVLIADGDLSGTLNWVVGQGAITAYGGAGTVVVAYDSQANTTSMWANALPLADPQSIVLDEDGSLAITLTGSDPDNDPLTYTVATPPASGSLSGTAPNLTYTPDANFNGVDSFTFTVNDGTQGSAAATVSITVNPVNDAPGADAQAVFVNEDGSLGITLTGSDPDSDSLTYTVATQPASGSLSGSAPNLIYTPTANFNGDDSFTFTVNDGTVDSAVATVSITVNPVNDAPVFSSDPIAAANAMENALYIGSLSATDSDGDSLTYSKVSGPAWLTVAADGALGGTPLGADTGANSWTVQVSDGNGGTDQATLNMTVDVDPNPALRVTEYYLSTGDFTGTTATLTLDQDLADDYYVLVRGSRDGDGTSNPNNDYARVSAVPGGQGDLADSGALNQITLQRQAADLNWEGVVTVVECSNSASASGFKLVDAKVTAMTTTSGAVTSAAWTDINQVVLFGGYRGGGVEMFGAPTSSKQGTGCYTRLYASGSDTLNWSRDAGGETMFDATMTTFVVEWGSDWTVQHVNVAGSTGGDGADATAEYTTAAIATVTRANTWVWATGTRVDSGIGDSAEACLITLGDGVTQNATESTVAIGSEYSDALDFDVYVMTHSNLAVDHRFKVDGDSALTDLAQVVDTASAGARFGWVTNGCNGTGAAFPRPRMWARYTADGEITISRGYSGQSFPAWIQAIDLSGVNSQ